jgi:hypothetical protein
VGAAKGAAGMRVEAPQDFESFLDALFSHPRCFWRDTSLAFPAPPARRAAEEAGPKRRESAVKLQQKALCEIGAKSPGGSTVSRRRRRSASKSFRSLRVLRHSSGGAARYPDCPGRGRAFPQRSLRGGLSRDQRQLQGEMLFEGCRGGEMFPELLVVEMLVLDGPLRKAEKPRERVSRTRFSRAAARSPSEWSNAEASQKERQGEKGQFRLSRRAGVHFRTRHGHIRWCF